MVDKKIYTVVCYFRYLSEKLFNRVYTFHIKVLIFFPRHIQIIIRVYTFQAYDDQKISNEVPNLHVFHTNSLNILLEFTLFRLMTTPSKNKN